MDLSGLQRLPIKDIINELDEIPDNNGIDKETDSSSPGDDDMNYDDDDTCKSTDSKCESKIDQEFFLPDETPKSKVHQRKKAHLSKEYNVGHKTHEKKSISPKNEKQQQKKIKTLYPDLSKVIEDAEYTEAIKKSEKLKAFRIKNTFYYLFLLIFIIIAYFVIYNLYSIPERVAPKLLPSTTIVNALRLKFPNQPKLSFKIVKVALSDVLDSEDVPESPGILMLLASKGAEVTNLNFARHLASLISESKNDYLEIKGRELEHIIPERAKQLIEDEIESALGQKHKRVVLLNEIDRMSGKAVMIMHSYCDHENGPYKKVVFIMTASSNAEISKNGTSKDFDGYAKLRLNEAWNDLHSDIIPGLFARLLVSVAVILPDGKA